MKIGVLGAGNMGKAIIKGLANKYNPKDIYVETPHIGKVKDFQEKVGFNLVDDYKKLLDSGLDILFLVTPAPVTLSAVKELKQNGLQSSVGLISAAGGISNQKIKDIVPDNPVACIIPNIPVAVNAGTIASYIDKESAEKKSKSINEVLSSLGNVINVKEKDLGIVGVLGGCGPAYVDVFMAAMGDAGVENGLDRPTAYKVIASMVEGSGKLAYDTEETPADLKDEVTSPGGSTIKGVVALDKNNFRAAVIDAVNKSNGN